MKGIPLTTLLVASGIALAQATTPSSQQTPAPAPPTGPIAVTEIEALLKKFNVPGVSVAVIRNFAVDWARGYGVGDVESGAAVTTETMFQARSARPSPRWRR
jgi:CubicO group peptidase (beta-lactamase class C family)